MIDTSMKKKQLVLQNFDFEKPSLSGPVVLPVISGPTEFHHMDDREENQNFPIEHSNSSKIIRLTSRTNKLGQLIYGNTRWNFEMSPYKILLSLQGAFGPSGVKCRNGIDQTLSPKLLIEYELWNCDLGGINQARD